MITTSEESRRESGRELVHGAMGGAPLLGTAAAAQHGHMGMEGRNESGGVELVGEWEQLE